MSISTERFVEQLRDPVTGEWMIDAVMLPCGHTISERIAIFRRERKLPCPIGEDHPVGTYIPNLNIREMVREYCSSLRERITTLPLYLGDAGTPASFQPSKEKKGGTAIGTIYTYTEGIQISYWIGKVGEASNLLQNKAFSVRTKTRREMNLTTIQEKIACDFYTILGKGLFDTPRTCLSSQPLSDRYTEGHFLVEEYVHMGIQNSLRIMSRFAEGYQDFAHASTLHQGEPISFVAFLEKEGRPPEEILAPDGTLVPLLGVMELIAVGRVIGDTDLLGGGGGNAGFVWSMNHLGKITAARTLKIDPGFAFQVVGSEAGFNVVHNTLHKYGGRQFWEADLRNIQVANQNLSINILWEKLTSRQKDEFLKTIRLCLKTLADREDLFFLFYRDGAFHRDTDNEMPQDIAELYVTKMQEWLVHQQTIYANELSPQSLLMTEWSFNFQLSPINPINRRPELESFISGLQSQECDLQELKARFDYTFDQCEDDVSMLSDLIELCCPSYAAKLCFNRDYESLRLLHEKLFKGIKLKSLPKGTLIAEELEKWADRFLEKQLLSQAQQFYLIALQMHDEMLKLNEMLSPVQIGLLEKIGDTHQFMHNYVEAMKYYFFVASYQETENIALHQKMIGTYRDFLGSLNVTDYCFSRLEQQPKELIKLIGDELLIQEKFRQAANVYRLSKDLAKDVQQVTQLIDKHAPFNFASCTLPWTPLKERLRKIREEVKLLSLEGGINGIQVQNVITEKYRVFFQELIQRSMIILGSPPTMKVSMGLFEDDVEIPYAFVALGSMSFGGMSLYSDLEFVILVGNNIPEVIDYFTKLTQILEIFTIFLGETPPHHFAEDSRFQRGLAFDDKGNTPLGAGQHRQGQAGILQGADHNIKTPAEMARMIPPKNGLIENLILSHALCSAGLLCGAQALFTNFVQERKKILNDASRTFCTRSYITETLSFPPSLYQEGKLNVKKDLYRMLSLLILELSFYYKGEKTTLFERLNELKNLGIVDDFFVEKIRRGLDFAATLRNQAQIFYGNEHEEVFENGDESHFALAKTDQDQLLENYYTILLPIRRYIELFESVLTKEESSAEIHLSLPLLHISNPLMKQAVAEGYYAYGEELFNKGKPQSLPYQVARKYDIENRLVEKVDQKLMLIQLFGPYFKESDSAENLLPQAFIQFAETMTQKQFFDAVHELSLTPFINQFMKIVSPDRFASYWSERGFQHALRADYRRFSGKLCELSQQGTSPYVLNTWRNGKLFLSKDFKDLLDYNKKTGYSLKRHNKHGRRNTHPFRNLYVKENPEMPGIEFAIYLLKKLFFGCGAAFSDFGTLTLPEGGTLHLQLSETIEGINFADFLKDEPQSVKEINPTNFSQLLLATLLINPEDDRPDNFIATWTMKGVMLTCIDNDHGFANQATLPGSHTPLVKSILFCLPQMQALIDPEAREMFCQLDAAFLLQQWLKELKGYNETIFKFEDAPSYSQLLKDKEIYIPIFLKQGLMSRLYNRIICLQTFLKKNKPYKHIDLLHMIEPELAIFFSNLPKKPPLELYFKEIYKKGYLAKGDSYKTQSTTTNMVHYQMGKMAPKKTKIETHELKDAGAIQKEIEELRQKEQKELVHAIEFEIEKPNESLNSAQRELLWRGKGVLELQKIQRDLKSGNIKTFQALIEVPVFQEEIINTLDLTEMSLKEQRHLLDACVGMRIANLKLRRCTVIDFVHKLVAILHTSGEYLLHLDISHSQGLQSTAMIAKYCPNLQELILDDIQTLETIEHAPKRLLSNGEFQQLHNLSAKKCSNLKRIAGLPALAVWDFSNCPINVIFDWMESEKKLNQFIKDSVEKKDPTAQLLLGLCYEKGKGVPQSYTNAVKLYQLAFQQGCDEGGRFFISLSKQKNAATWYDLGESYYYGRKVTQSFEEAVIYYTLAIAQGDANAQYSLGFCYVKGQGVAKSEEEAVRLYTLASAQGNASAQFNLGVCYENGRGVAKSEEEAVRLYTLAAAQGNASAQLELGVRYTYGRGVGKSDAEAVRLFTLAAAQENANAQFNLGVCYNNGDGVAKSEEEAVRLYTLAAAQGNAGAQFYLGLCYAKGQGVAKSEEEAVRLYTLAAAQGNAGAQLDLGVCYAYGKGVAKSDAEAVRLFTLAAAQGNVHAQHNLGFCYANGQGVAKSEEEAVRLYTLSAAQGYGYAQIQLGDCYQNGQGVAKSEEEAVRLYTLAAAQGNAQAQHNLGCCYVNGQGVAKSHEEAVRLYTLAAAQGYAYAQNELGVCYTYG